MKNEMDFRAVNQDDSMYLNYRAAWLKECRTSKALRRALNEVLHTSTEASVRRIALEAVTCTFEEAEI